MTDLMQLSFVQEAIIVQYSPWIGGVFLSLGLIFFVVGRTWDDRRKKNSQGRNSYFPSLLVLTGIFSLIAGIHFYVFKLKITDQGVTVYSIKDFNHKILWNDIHSISVSDNRLLSIKIGRTDRSETPPPKVFEFLVMGMTGTQKQSLEKSINDYYQRYKSQ